MIFSTQVFPVENEKRYILTVISDTPLGWNPGDQIIEPLFDRQIHYDIDGLINKYEQDGNHIYQFIYQNKYTVLNDDVDMINVLREEAKALKSTAESLVKETTLMHAQIKAQTDRGEFLEDCIAEMAMMLYA